MRPLILFVAAGKGTRARMAAAFLEHLAGDRYAPLVAGADALEETPAEVGEAMTEAGIDLTRAAGASLTPRLARSAQRIIFLGPPDEHPPPLPVAFERWGIPSPDGRGPDEVRIIRDTVRRLVERLVARLDTEALVR